MTCRSCSIRRLDTRQRSVFRSRGGESDWRQLGCGFDFLFRHRERVCKQTSIVKIYKLAYTTHSNRYSVLLVVVDIRILLFSQEKKKDRINDSLEQKNCRHERNFVSSLCAAAQSARKHQASPKCATILLEFSSYSSARPLGSLRSPHDPITLILAALCSS